MNASWSRPFYKELGWLPIYGHRQKHVSASRGTSFPLGRVMNPPTANAAWNSRKEEILTFQDLLHSRGILQPGTTVVETKSPNIDKLNFRRFLDDEQLDAFETWGLPFEMLFDALDRESTGLIDIQLLCGYTDPNTTQWQIMLARRTLKSSCCSCSRLNK